jgi:hypothetical protein
MEGMRGDDVTVRCGVCGAKMGGAVGQDFTFTAWLPPRGRVRNKYDREYRRQMIEEAGSSPPLVRPLDGSDDLMGLHGATWLERCPGLDCPESYDIGEIRAAVAAARRRGKRSAKVHHNAHPPQ